MLYDTLSIPTQHFSPSADFSVYDESGNLTGKAPSVFPFQCKFVVRANGKRQIYAFNMGEARETEPPDKACSAFQVLLMSTHSAKKGSAS